MNTALLITLAALSVGFVWGYLTPRGYCSVSSKEAQSVKYRIGGGLINGLILGAIIGIISFIALGEA